MTQKETCIRYDVPSKHELENRKRRRKASRRYEELKFSDDFMFGKVMEDKKLCREVLECLLRQPVGELTDMHLQKQFCYTQDGKPIRLDVCASNDEAIYDAEMQNLNHVKPEKLELSKRSRFYQSLMDTDFLQKGQSYRQLPEGRVLFLCTFDPFQRDFPVYSFMNYCSENTDIMLADGTQKIFFNCICQREDMPKNLRKLYGYIMNETATDALTMRIKDAVERGRRNEEWRSEYMKELLHDDDIRTDALAEGIELGRSEGIKGFILDKLEDGITEDVIIQRLVKRYTLTVEEAAGYLNECQNR